MNNRNRTHIFFCLTIALILLGAFNATAASIKDRMVERIPAINALKGQGLIGENNIGYLDFRSSNQPEKDLVKAENADRRKVYSAIAKKQGVKPNLVGQRRAKQIADKGSAGYWYQNQDGNWYKKK